MKAELAPSQSAPITDRPKVLHVGKFYPPHMGGIETHLQALCEQLRQSLPIGVVVSSDGVEASREFLRGVPVSRVATRLVLASTPLCPSVIGEIRRSDADIVHLHLPNPMAVLAYLASGHPGKLVVTYHSDTVRQRVLGAFFQPLLHRLLRRSAAIIATSPGYRRTSLVLSRHLDRCHVIPYGIPLDQFEYCEPSAVDGLRKKYGDRLVISVGRLVYYKGFEYLIRAMAKVNGKLLIAGDGPLRPSLEKLSRELGLGERVVLLGEIQNQELIPYYHAADVFALASVARSEAFGIVQIEAMASGLPVINTNLDSGVPFVSRDGETGLTVPPKDSDALAAALNHLLDNPELRRSLGGAARARARQEFSVATMASRTFELYSQVARGRR